MAEAQRPKPDAKVEAKPAAAPLARASESTDPAVHQLLAEWQAHEMNKVSAASGVAETVQKADEAQADIVRRLNELGYE